MKLPPDLERKVLEMAEPPAKKTRGKSPFSGNKKHNWSKGGKKKPVIGQQQLFCKLCELHGIEAPDYEYEFCEGRKWRADYIFYGWLILEIEGGVWKEGRHVQGQGFLNDIEKYNEMVILGYSLIRCTPDEITSGAVFPLIKRALGAREEQH